MWVICVLCSSLPEGTVYHYDVHVVPADPKDLNKIPKDLKLRPASTIINRLVMMKFAQTYKANLGNCLPAYDGRSNAYFKKKLPNDMCVSKSSLP